MLVVSCCVYVCTCVLCAYICMYVSMYVCMYVCLHVCMCVCTYVCMYVCMHIGIYDECMYKCLHVCIFVCMYLCEDTTCSQLCTYVCMYVCSVYVCMRKYMFHWNRYVFCRDTRTYVLLNGMADSHCDVCVTGVQEFMVDADAELKHVHASSLSPCANMVALGELSE